MQSDVTECYGLIFQENRAEESDAVSARNLWLPQTGPCAGDDARLWFPGGTEPEGLSNGSAEFQEEFLINSPFF